MAVVKKTRGRVWENQETMLLLQKWGDENTQVKLLSCTRKKPICIGNHMISSAIWDKSARVNFSKANQIARARRASAICGL